MQCGSIASRYSPTELQISGDGPFDINYPRPGDEPRTKN
jgi:hypothetical protein